MSSIFHNPFGRPLYTWENNIRMYLKGIRLKGVDWMYLAQDGDH